MNIRKATKNDIKVVEGLFEFIKSLDLDIFNKYGSEKVMTILNYCFKSEEDRFSYRFCNVLEENNNILGFSFSYNYDDVLIAEKYWKESVISNFNLSSETIIFDYDEVLLGEYYLDTLYVFSCNRGKGIGKKLLTHFKDCSKNLRSLNVAQSNAGAKKLYESVGFVKSCEIKIGNELYDHMILE